MVTGAEARTGDAQMAADRTPDRGARQRRRGDQAVEGDPRGNAHQFQRVDQVLESDVPVLGSSTSNVRVVELTTRNVPAT